MSAIAAAGPAIVLLNPHAGGGRAAALVAPIAQWLATQAPQVALHERGSVDGARAVIAAQARGSRVVLVGGDGTLHHMLPALLERGVSLGLVPFGSGNDTARALRLAGLAWPVALAHALAAPASPIDVGTVVVDGVATPFASSLTAGFDSAVGERALAGPRWLRGLPRYLLATLRELAALRHWPLHVEADGVTVHDGDALFASVLNTPSYGSGMPVVPQARIDDGRLDLLVAGRFGRAGAALMLPRLLAARHLSHPRVLCLPFATLTISSRVDVPLAGDGEPLGSARRWTVRVRPGALQVVGRWRADS
jgi:diacylglycerol kinase family enzyme